MKGILIHSSLILNIIKGFGFTVYKHNPGISVKSCHA